MAGLYIHIPFCTQKCSYCNFHFSTNQKLKSKLIDAIICEAEIRKKEIPDTITSIYFGGGTPSVFTPSELGKILESISTNYSISTNTEWTIEVNPEDVNPFYLNELSILGFNRLSIGIQSFKDKDLQLMNRAHNAESALKALDAIAESEFENYSLDLIYGSPTTSHQDWEYNLKTAIEFLPKHISAYALTVEKKTLLEHKIAKHEWPEIDDEHQQTQFNTMVDFLTSKGFEHYEISNLGLPGYRAEHNSSYWKGEPYLGFGPSAHSFSGNSRRWNVSNNAIYIQNILKNQPYFEIEELSSAEQFNEVIMTALRTIEGLNINEITRRFSNTFQSHLQKEAHYLIQKGLLVQEGSFLQVPKNKRFYSDGIAADLFYVD